MKQNKFLYVWKLWVNYGHGWEHETTELTRAAYRENRKAYRDNCTYPQRWTRARELNPDYVETPTLESLPIDDALTRACESDA